MWAYETTFYQIYPLAFAGLRAKTPRPLPRMSSPSCQRRAQPRCAHHENRPMGRLPARTRYWRCADQPPLESDSHAMIRAACAISTAAWVGMPILPPYARRCTPMASAWCSMPSSTTSVAAFGPSAMCRSVGGTRPTRTGSTSALTVTRATATAFGTRLGGPF